jgi:hypothetical protein
MTSELPPDDRMPDCGRVRAELVGFVYAELAPDPRAALQRHLEACPACREELEVVRDTQRALSRWETPSAEEDPRALARAIAARSRPPAAQGARRGRLVRWSARLAGAAAAALFVFGLLNTRASYEGGRFELSFGRSAPTPVRDGGWHDEMRAIAAQEVALRTAGLEESQAESFQRLQLLTREELLRLAQAVDSALAEKQEVFDANLVRLGQEAHQADLETRRVLTDLVNYLPVTPTRR